MSSLISLKLPRLTLSRARLSGSRPHLAQWAASPVVWSLAVTILLAVAMLAGQEPPLSNWLGDTDDAVRLVTVRDLLDGAPWFDTTLPRIGAPEPLVSHWSRLIDLPLAALITVLTPVLGAELAELATRVIWPTLLLFGLFAVIAREAQRQAGAWAAAFAIMLAATSVMAFVQFRPGRVDHHNAQILCAAAGLWLTVRSWDEPRVGWSAGALLGLGLAVGYEAVALVGPALGLAAATAVWQPQRSTGILRVCVAACAAMTVALMLAVAPSHWFAQHCDALSLNLPVLAGCCTAGLWAALRYGAHAALRFAIAGAGCAMGVAAFGALEPVCLAGPFGQVNPELAAAWLVNVSETKSIFAMAAEHPASALGSLAFMLAGTGAQLALLHKRRDLGTSLATAIMLLALVLGCWQLKLVPYASWLAALPIAVFAAGLPGTASISAPVLRIAAALLLSQATFDAGLQAAISPFQRTAAGAPTTTDSSDLRQACYQSDSVGRLAALPAGLVASEINLGPYIVAMTTHRVVAAPYHRIDKGILAMYAILKGTPADALARLRTLGADYVALCAEPAKSATAPAPEPAGPSLRMRLLDNQHIGGLAEIKLDGLAAIRVWKVSTAR